MENKLRLDALMVEKGLAASRQRAKALIEAGGVSVNGVSARKASFMCLREDEILSAPDIGYVGRGGLKLEGALQRFPVDVQGKTALDVGASTGGFTQCLLNRGAAKVFAVDVGRGQLSQKLLGDTRVISMENTDIRDVRPEDLGGPVAEAVALAVCDVSFISLRLVLPAISGLLRANGEIIALIKPQFEAGRRALGKKGVVKNPDDIKKAIADIAAFAGGIGLGAHGLCPSPIRGGDGNAEFFIWLSKSVLCEIGPGDIQRAMEEIG